MCIPALGVFLEKMIELRIDIVKDFEKYVLNDINEFKALGFKFTNYNEWEQQEKIKDQKFEGKPENEKKNLFNQHLIYEYSNLCERLIPAKPREIIYSKNFIRKVDCENGLKLLEDKIRNGNNLTPHLSRKILQANYSDGLLFDFGIYHLHLGEQQDEKHPILIEGKDDILYAAFTENKAFFICIDKHGKWGDTELLRIIQSEFPEVLEKWEYVTEPSSYPTEKERIELRKIGINTPVEVNGKYYITPGGGINTARTSSSGVLKMIRQIRFYKTIDNQLRLFFDKHNQEIQERLKISGVLSFTMTKISPMEFTDLNKKLRLIPNIDKEDKLIGITIKSIE